jgi:hypothetical protein
VVVVGGNVVVVVVVVVVGYVGGLSHAAAPAEMPSAANMAMTAPATMPRVCRMFMWSFPVLPGRFVAHSPTRSVCGP